MKAAISADPQGHYHKSGRILLVPTSVAADEERIHRVCVWAPAAVQGFGMQWYSQNSEPTAWCANICDWCAGIPFFFLLHMESCF